MKNLYIIIFLFIYQHISAVDTIRVQLKWKHQFQFAGYYIAKEKGYYEELGLNVKFIAGNETCSPVDSVFNNKAEMGISDTELLIQRNNGKAIVALLAIYQHSPLIFLAKKDSGIRNIHDIIGKRVMLEKQSIELEAYLINEGIDKDSCIIHPYLPNALLKNNEINFTSAYITDEPYLLKLHNIDHQIFTPQSAGIDFYGDILFTSEDFIQNNLDDVENFIHATRKGWEYALSHIDETVNIIYNTYSNPDDPNHKDIEHLFYEAHESKKLIRNDKEIGYMFEGRWKHIGDIYVKLGMLNPDFTTEKFIYSKKDYRKTIELWYFPIIAFAVAVVIFIFFAIIISFGIKHTKVGKFILNIENND